MIGLECSCSRSTIPTNKAVICRIIPKKRNESLTLISSNSIRAHYEGCWTEKSESTQWQLGPMQQLVPEFTTLRFPPTRNRKMWTYATCGMSSQADAPPIELHLFSPFQTESHVELLTAIAYYHMTGAYLDLGHTVNFGRAWLPESKCMHGLISLPYLDGPKLEWLSENGQKVRFLWLLPITDEELKFKLAHGLDALEDNFQNRPFDYVNPSRPSVV